MASEPPPPPPPPHGASPRSTGGLPPGNYDIFIIPPHSSGSGFLYLPSLQPQRNSFLAGVASTVLAFTLYNLSLPILKQWFGVVMAGGGGIGVLALVIAVGVGAWAIGKTQAEAFKGPREKPESNTGPPPPQSGFTGQEHEQQHQQQHQQQHHHQQHQQQHQHQHHYQQQQHKYPGAPPPFHGQAPPTPPQPEYHEPQTPPQSPRPPPAAEPEPEAAPPPPPPPPPPPQQPQPPPPPRTNPNAASGWEKAREETRKREEERRRAEEVRKKREEAQRIREEAEKAAKVKAEKEKWEQARAREKEAREKEARERIIKERLAREKEAREKETKEREAREKAEKDKADRDKAVHDRLQQLEREKAERDRADREKAEREKADRERAERERIILGKAQAAATTAAQTAASVRSSPLKPSAYQQPSARSHVGTEDEHSYRPYDVPRSAPASKAFTHHPAGSSTSGRSESSYAASHSTSRTTPPPSHRGPYSTDDPAKIQVRAVYQFSDNFPGKPRAQLISGQGAVTDGLVLRIETEGLFIDDDVRGVPQREWDVKAWTLKSVENSGRVKIAGHGPMGPAAGGVLQVIRASLRDGENRRYCFVLEEREAWKVEASLVRLKKGSQVRSLAVTAMKEGDARGLLNGLGWI